jgi:hypothetical protein
VGVDQDQIANIRSDRLPIPIRFDEDQVAEEGKAYCTRVALIWSSP